MDRRALLQDLVGAYRPHRMPYKEGWPTRYLEAILGWREPEHQPIGWHPAIQLDACAAAGVDRSTVYDLREKHPPFASIEALCVRLVKQEYQQAQEQAEKARRGRKAERQRALRIQAVRASAAAKAAHRERRLLDRLAATPKIKPFRKAA